MTAESAMLGLYLTNPDAWTRWPTVAAHYTLPAYRAIHAAMAALMAKGLELSLVTVPAETARLGEAVADSLVATLACEAPATGDGLLAELREARARRTLTLIGATLTRSATDVTVDPLEALEATTERAFREMRDGSAQDAPAMAEHEAAWRKSLDAADALPAVRTPWGALNGLLDGLPRGELTIIAARPGVGKSAMAAQLGLWNAARGRHVLFCSAEMTARQVVERLKSAQTGIALERVRRGGRLWTQDEAVRLMQPLPAMRLCDRAGMTTQMIADVTARVAAQRPLDLVLVDHLHHLSDRPDRGESRYEQIGRMVNRLKTLAKQHGCAVVVVCQLNRQAADTTPTMAHLRDAGTIEEYANVIMLLHRPAAEDEAPPTDLLPTCDVRVEKQRNGPTGFVRLQWDGEHTQFRSLNLREEAAA